MNTENNEQSFLKSVKGKVIFGFVVACLALGASWIISKGAFDQMLETVDQLSTPDEKLRLVNVIFKDILLLDQLQNEMPGTSREEIKQGFVERSDKLQGTLDTLSLWFSDNPQQLARIDSIRVILKKRAAIFDDYVKVRTVLVNNRDFKNKVESISGLITTSTEAHPDSTIIKTEKRTTTTTIFRESPSPAAPSPETEESGKRGFLSKVFRGKKTKDEETAVPPVPVVVQKEEVQVSIDTLSIAKNDSVIQKVGAVVKDMASSQFVRTNRFVERERELLQGENILITQLMEVMREVEGEIINQMNRDNQQAKTMVTKSINIIGMIILGVFSLSALLGYLIFADITQSNQYRRALVAAKEDAEYHSQAKQRFLSNMSHEIRTPLQSIIGYTELIKNQEKPAKEELEIIGKSSEHLLYLVNEILDYSRIISDRFEFMDESFNLPEAMEEVIGILRPEANRKGLLLKLSHTFEPQSYMSGDAFRLKQILHNLLGNAIKFTHTGQVELVADLVQVKGRDEIRLEVRDTGIGLSREQMKRVFNQFEQANATIAPQYGGAGLGLSIVKSLVQGQGGRIDVKSDPGKFTSFIIHLPFKPGEVPATEGIGELTEKGHAFQGKVWIIDDDVFILDWIAAVLERYGVAYSRFSSGIEALNQPWEPEVTIVLADMRMPGMSGAELCRQLKTKSGAHVRYYAATAMALPEEKASILEMGFEDVLMKPFKSSDILRILQIAPAGSAAVPAGETPVLDLAPLKAMTMGDDVLLRESLGQFVADTRDDLSRVSAHLDNGRNPDELRELFHKMAGRTGQIGAKDLGVRMRDVEISLSHARLPEQEMRAIVAEGYRLVGEITEKYIS